MSLPLFAASLIEVQPALIFWTLVTFILVAIFLRWKAWGPILGMVEEREKQITNAVEAAKKERAEAEKILGEQKKAIAEARGMAVNLAIEVAQKLLAENLNEPRHRALAEQFVDQLSQKAPVRP